MMYLRVIVAGVYSLPTPRVTHGFINQSWTAPYILPNINFLKLRTQLFETFMSELS